jgi:catechol 2,3-dioxygenase-like lactoylglutathione lyase family enzyme
VPQEVIPIVHVSDVSRSVAWYEQLGFLFEWEHRFAPDLPAFVSISRGHARIYLSEHEGDASPDSLLYIRHSHLDQLARVFDATPKDVPWGRELELRDPDGNRLRISDPLED